jgi:hypothetical protein
VSHPVAWVTAAPAWEGTPQPPGSDPMLLRFASDSFMEDLQQLLDTQPGALPALRAPKESFRAKPLGKDASWTSPEPPLLKLYQPIHGHFYLVTAALVCRLPGFPDHEIQPAQQEKVSFVLRRVKQNSEGGELAWTNDPLNGRGWVETSADTLAPYEQLHPLAPMNFTVVDGRRRRLFVGLVPTATRDTYPAGRGVDPFPTTTPAGTPLDTRRNEVNARIIGGLATLADAAQPSAEAAQFTLLDFGDYLRAQLDTSSWDLVFDTTPPAPGDQRLHLWTTLNRTVGSTLTLRGAIQSALAQADAITGETATAAAFPASLAADLRTLAQSLLPAGERPRGKTLADAISSALPLAGATTATEGQPASSIEVPKLAGVPAIDGADMPPRFQLRCVYLRPQCEPFEPALISAPTETFTFAQFFDFDAPQRLIRIPLPVDTSIKDLRKFRKNVSFVLSEQLKNQMNQIGALKDVMDGKVEQADSSTLGFGMICSFSIPIITICALLVLMIFLSLLNIVFWWKPFFRICFPFPKRASA